MLDVVLNQDGDNAVLKIVTHFGVPLEVPLRKEAGQSFRLSYTGVSDIFQARATVLEVNKMSVKVDINGRIEYAIRLNDEIIKPGEVVVIQDYYDLHSDGTKASYLATKILVEDPRLIFVNVDCLNKQFVVERRFRFSPFTGSYLIIGGDGELS
jgi:hypothetical protein